MREFKTHHFRFGQVTSFDSVKIIRNGEPILYKCVRQGVKLLRHPRIQVYSSNRELIRRRPSNYSKNAR
jgi:hypothetical protein